MEDFLNSYINLKNNSYSDTDRLCFIHIHLNITISF